MAEKREIFTVKTYTEGEHIGSIQLLRGDLDQSIAASNNVRGLLLPANKFIRLILKEKDFLNSFSLVDSIELYCTVICFQHSDTNISIFIIHPTPSYVKCVIK